MAEYAHELNALSAVNIYREINREDVAQKIIKANFDMGLEGLVEIRFPWNRGIEPWEHTDYAYGYISPDGNGDEISLQNASSIMPDTALRNAYVNMSLDRLRVFDYPGKGRHNVLFKFSATNHVNGVSDVASFNQLFTIQEGQAAAVKGYPVFLNLKLGTDVLKLDTEIVNVSNETDDKLLETMKSPVFKGGLKLIGAINPALSIVTEYATGITEMIANRNRNLKIVAPSMGFYFDTTPAHMKIREGSFVAIQISDPSEIVWNEWVYNRNTGLIKKANEPEADLPYNYFIFSISKSYQPGDEQP